MNFVRCQVDGINRFDRDWENEPVNLSHIRTFEKINNKEYRCFSIKFNSNTPNDYSIEWYFNEEKQRNNCYQTLLTNYTSCV